MRPSWKYWRSSSRPRVGSARRRRSISDLRVNRTEVVLTACGTPAGDDSEARPVLGSVSHALTDTDSDSMDDDWEVLHFGNLSQTAAGDFDSDGMTNAEEYVHGFLPAVADGFEDADGDRYPN